MKAQAVGVEPVRLEVVAGKALEALVRRPEDLRHDGGAYPWTMAADWIGHAHMTLERGGYRVSGPRAAVVATLADLGCSVTAKEIADRLREGGEEVGVASIYRALDLLDRLGLARRVDVADGVARYEPAGPRGEHHHHLVCDGCGEVSAFEDPELERTIARLADRVDYAVDAHEVTLRGECPSCRTAGA